MSWSLEQVSDLYRRCRRSYSLYHEGSGLMHMPLLKEGASTRAECLSELNEIILANGYFAEDETVLDLGCGLGVLLIEAASRFRSRGLGIASTNYEVEEAQERASRAGVRERCRFDVGDMNNLGALCSNSVASAVNLETDWYFNSLPKGIRELHRILVPNGEWHSVRASIDDGFSQDVKARGLARKVCRGWRTSDMLTTGEFEIMARELFVIDRVIDLGELVMGFWERFVPLPVDAEWRVRLRFALRASQEVGKWPDFSTVFWHRLAFWQLIYGLSKGWFRFRYYLLRGREDS